MRDMRESFNKPASRLSFAALKRGMWDLVVNTPIEIPVGAVIVGLAAGLVSYSIESGKRGQIPLAFSEISQTRLYVEKIRGLKIPPLTVYYSSLNDLIMQVFEANNLSYTWTGGSAKHFAYELEKKVDVTARIHTQIPEYAARLPGHAVEALKPLAKLDDANMALLPVIGALKNTWDESHRDVYHTETESHQVCTTDSKGKQSCHTEITTKQVYDYTIHRYTYNARAGAQAAGLLQDFTARYPDVKIGEKLFPAWQTNAENEWAIRESRKRDTRNKALTREQYLDYTNTWATGSNYAVLTPRIDEDHAGLVQTAPEWNKAKDTARDYRYRTYRHSDPGPAEYRVSMAALDHAVREAKNIARITGGIRYAAEKAPALSEKIQDFVDISLHGKKGNPRGMASAILRDARDIYQLNFAGGFDVKPMKWETVFGWTLMGLAGGAAAGYGADRLIARRQERRPRLT